MRISTNMKRAAVIFVVPEHGRATEGRVDLHLRAAIDKAFWKECQKPARHSMSPSRGRKK